MGNHLTYKIFFGNKIDKILIENILVQSIAHKYVFETIIVIVCDQGTPAPIRRFDPCQSANLTESAIPVV